MNLTERGYSFTASADRNARDVKENPGYIGLDYDTELKSIAKFDKKKTYVLPDRNIISVSAGRFHCAEILYQPGFIDQEAYGIHDTSFQNVMKCDVDTRKDLYDNVVLASGTTICQGMVERMKNELTALAPCTMRSRWLLRFGGSILSTSSQTQKHHHCHAEHFRGVEVLIQPSFIGKEASGSTTRRGYLQRVVRQCRAVRWHDHFLRDR